MWDYLFVDYESGEEFFVECKTLKEAWQIVRDNWGDDSNIDFEGRFTVAQAEAIGYDTY